MTKTNTKTRRLGVTPPISIEFSTPEDVAANEILVKILHDSGLYEEEEEALRREAVLGKLNQIIQEWVQEKASSEYSSAGSEVKARLLSFGSYRLGVHGKGADIDMLCVGPSNITRECFFTDFYENLLNLPQCVTDAYVPVIKFRFLNIDIDLLYSRICVSSIFDDMNLFDDNILKNTAENKSILSLNGPRVTDMILHLVPNKETFRTSLRTIKLWAKRRAIYSNVTGYLGGVSWAILVARICQLYPNVVACVIIEKFFRFFNLWKWPNPIQLCEMVHNNLGLPVWDPNSVKDKQDKMPILTPAYPTMNSTHNVSMSTLKVLKNECSRALEIMMKMIQPNADKIEIWKEIFEYSDFFTKYSHFLMIIVRAKKQHDLKWLGWVESRIRQLVLRLETIQYVECAPYPYVHDDIDLLLTNTNLESNKSINTEKENSNSTMTMEQNNTNNTTVSEIVSETKDERENKNSESTITETETESSVIQTPVPATPHTFFIGMRFSLPKDNIQKIDLSSACNEFLKIVRENYNGEKEGQNIEIKHLRPSQLPEYVFKTDKRPKKYKRKNADMNADMENDKNKNGKLPNQNNQPESIDVEKNSDCPKKRKM